MRIAMGLPPAALTCAAWWAGGRAALSLGGLTFLVRRPGLTARGAVCKRAGFFVSLHSAFCFMHSVHIVHVTHPKECMKQKCRGQTCKFPLTSRIKYL